MRPHQTANHLTIFEDRQGWNSLNAQVSSQTVILLTGVNIHFSEGQPPLVLVAQTLVDGGNGPARTAPRGPEINDYRYGGLDHLLLKVSIIHVEQVGVCIHYVFSSHFLH